MKTKERCMRRWLYALLCSSVLCACLVPAVAQEPATVTATVAVSRYDARAFYSTTSFGLASAHAFSADGSQLLIHSDANGIFNAFALNVADGSQQPLTN